MVVRRLHRLAQRAAVGRLAVDDAFLHPFEQQGAGDFVIEVVVEPCGQPADLGAVRRGAVDHRLAFDGFLEIRSEEHTSELQSLMRISYAVFCLKKKTTKTHTTTYNNNSITKSTYK